MPRIYLASLIGCLLVLAGPRFFGQQPAAQPDVKANPLTGDAAATAKPPSDLKSIKVYGLK